MFLSNTQASLSCQAASQCPLYTNQHSFLVQKKMICPKKKKNQEEHLVSRYPASQHHCLISLWINSQIQYKQLRIFLCLHRSQFNRNYNSRIRLRNFIISIIASLHLLPIISFSIMQQIWMYSKDPHHIHTLMPHIKILNKLRHLHSLPLVGGLSWLHNLCLKWITYSPWTLHNRPRAIRIKGNNRQRSRRAILWIWSHSLHKIKQTSRLYLEV